MKVFIFPVIVMTVLPLLARADYYDLARREQKQKAEQEAANAQAKQAAATNKHNAELYQAVEAFANKQGGLASEIKPSTNENVFIQDPNFVNSVTFTTANNYDCRAESYGAPYINCINAVTGRHLDVGTDPITRYNNRTESRKHRR